MYKTCICVYIITFVVLFIFSSLVQIYTLSLLSLFWIVFHLLRCALWIITSGWTPSSSSSSFGVRALVTGRKWAVYDTAFLLYVFSSLLVFLYLDTYILRETLSLKALILNLVVLHIFYFQLIYCFICIFKNLPYWVLLTNDDCVPDGLFNSCRPVRVLLSSVCKYISYDFTSDLLCLSTFVV